MNLSCRAKRSLPARRKFASLLFASAGLMIMAHHDASGAMVTFSGDASGFDAAAGAVSIFGFDSIAAGTNIAGNTVSGMTFSSPDGNSLDVVRGLDTFTTGGFSGVVNASTNRLFPTSGDNVLSPGGLALVPGAALAERDSMSIVFATPTRAFGVDVLYQSLDVGSFVSYAVFGPSDNLLASGTVPGNSAPGGAPAGVVFMGFVSDSSTTNIGRIVFTETDGDAQFPDSNVGYDSLRIVNIVPEPHTYASLLAGLGVLGLLLRRRTGRT